MTQKGRQERHGNVIREMVALRWEPTHITKHCSRVVLLHTSWMMHIVCAFEAIPILLYCGLCVLLGYLSRLGCC